MRLTIPLALCLFSNSVLAIEPWSDQRLPESARTGLIAWFDASVQNAARKAVGAAEYAHMESADVWLDGSDRRRHLRAKNNELRPTFRDHRPGQSFLFDGENNAVEFAGGKLEVKSFTIFVVASPVSNSGDFRAILSGNEPGKNDYTSGVNIDQGPGFSNKWNTINAEGIGFGGAQNLLDRPVEFGTLHQFTLISEVGANGIRLFFDGRLAGTRRRTESTLRLDHLVVGARCYNNEGKPANVRGFFDGDIAEVLIYDRALKDDERQSVERYLKDKYAKVVPIAVARSGAPGTKPLVSVPNPPPVQMLVPGFSVRELPVDLPNINNVRYRHDGKLVALGYDGNIYLLTETDDGKFKVARFWNNKGEIRSPIGMSLTPPDYKLGQGVFVACKGKLSLLLDTDRDDVADKEIVVAQGWKELPHGVDALGVAIDKDGNIFFGLGCTDFTNAYLIDKEGKSHYDLKDERGTIMKVSPDFSKREIVCTGIRFPVGLTFNKAGDLFATDQEGATWLPNGNPLDELLHIQPGRHYGFPPRHPKHLPNVIDEPSTFDYGPQHQSVCGLTFNEPVNGGPTFGPAHWAGDAIVAGYSRGKLWRTKLVKTPSGYVAQTQLIACLNMLTVDSCVTPKGDLVVAVHSGEPDWGSGPTGKGKLYKISYTGRDEPQPVLTWAAGPSEVRIAFDKPLDPAHLADLPRKISIERGPYVRAGDRFESLRPGYAVVQQQMRAPRYEVPVLSVNVTPDRRTLIIATTETRPAHHYAVTIAGCRKKADGLPQHADIDLDFDLSGVTADWKTEMGATTSVWLPHFDLDVSRTLTAGSADHAEFWRNVANPGELCLRANLHLWQMLRPTVQPGSRIDHTWPEEEVRVDFTTSQLKRLVVNRMSQGRHDPYLTCTPEEMKVARIHVHLSVGGPLALSPSYSTREDSRVRPLALHRILTQWAQLIDEPLPRTFSELKGGNWRRGREIFFGAEAQCAKCHKVNGVGKDIGPDLSNLIHRDYDSVLRDIRFPSVAINPDHLATRVELLDGRSYSGILKKRDAGMVIADNAGVETAIDAKRIETIEHAPVSLMPEGLDKALGPEKLRDLLTFLMTEPLEPASLELKGEPPARSRAEVESIIKDSPPPSGNLRKLHILLATGPKDHGPGEHDYPLWRRRWVKLFDLADNVVVSECDGFPKPELLAKADVVVFYSNNPGWNAERAKELEAFLNRGGGAVFIHYAVDGHRNVDEFAKLIGLAWKGGASKFRHGALDLTVDPKHPITKGISKLKLVDESYWNLVGDPKYITLLASGPEEGKPQPLMWAREHGKGRVFVSIPGHYNWSFDDPLFRLVLLRGIAWSASEPADRFQSLIWPGARVSIQP